MAALGEHATLAGETGCSSAPRQGDIGVSLPVPAPPRPARDSRERHYRDHGWDSRWGSQDAGHIQWLASLSGQLVALEYEEANIRSRVQGQGREWCVPGHGDFRR